MVVVAVAASSSTTWPVSVVGNLITRISSHFVRIIFHKNTFRQQTQKSERGLGPETPERERERERKRERERDREREREKERERER